jgi:hypothetical protein
MTKRYAWAVSAVALLLPPVLLTVGALVLIPLVVIAVMVLPFVGPAVLAGMFTFADRAGQLESPGEPQVSLMNGGFA